VIGRIFALTRYELVGLLRRRWLWWVAGAGLLAVVLIALTTSGATTQAESDDFRSGAASLLLIGGLTLALCLGATTIFTGGITGSLGALVGSGARRTELTLSRIKARLIVMFAVLGLWCLGLQLASLAIGHGWDGPLAVHVAASAENYSLVLLITAATSTVLGPFVAGLVGLIVHVTAQAVTNLEAAADLGRLGSSNRLAHVMYNLLPRSVSSPMVVELQNRGAGGPAAPQFEINNLPIPLQAAGLGTVAWTLFWCGLFAVLCIRGMRRRTL
jgi:hypothetical protein